MEKVSKKLIMSCKEELGIALKVSKDATKKAQNNSCRGGKLK
jgi:hypothetical protein